MKRALLVLLGIFITAFFYMYISDISLFGNKEPIYYQDDRSDSDAISIKTAAVKDDEFTNYNAGRPQIASVIAVSPQEIQALQPQVTEVVELEGWELVWFDEFDKPNIDMEYWTRIDRKDNFNHELQYYQPANSYIEDGCLYLTAKKEEKSGKKYTSAMVETRDKLSVCYGRIEARMKLPAGRGLFPAFWMLENEGVYEADIMEMIGNEPYIIYGVNHYHTSVPRKTYGSIECDSTDEFHVYAFEWEKDELRWYLDDELYYKTSKGVPTYAMYMIFTLAVGGDWPGKPDARTVFPCSMVVDYVRVYSRK